MLPVKSPDKTVLSLIVSLSLCAGKPLARRVLNRGCMSNTHCFVREKSGVNQIVMLPSHTAELHRFNWWDALLVVGFLTAFVSLVFLLAH